MFTKGSNVQTDPLPEIPFRTGGGGTFSRITAAAIDHYNVRENRMEVHERDAYKCHYCESNLPDSPATLDHVTPVAEGGENSFENLVTACLGCNSRKNKRPLGDFLAETNRQ